MSQLVVYSIVGPGSFAPLALVTVCVVIFPLVRFQRSHVVMYVQGCTVVLMQSVLAVAKAFNRLMGVTQMLSVTAQVLVEIKRRQVNNAFGIALRFPFGCGAMQEAQREEIVAVKPVRDLRLDHWCAALLAPVHGTRYGDAWSLLLEIRVWLVVQHGMLQKGQYVARLLHRIGTLSIKLFMFMIER